MFRIFTLRITPVPLSTSSSSQTSVVYSADYLSSLFDNKKSFVRVLMFQEIGPPVHFHLHITTSMTMSGLRKWLVRWLPLLKGNKYFSIHPCDNCKKHKDCINSGRTYTAKEGQWCLSKGYSIAEVCEYVAIGKELAITAKLTANDSRRLKYIGNLFQKSPDIKKLGGFILKWYSTQGLVPPSRTIVRTLIRQVLYKYDAHFRDIYELALDETIMSVHDNPL